MHLIYIDDSGDEQLCIFSALAIPVAEWHTAFQQVKEFRRALKRNDALQVAIWPGHSL